MYQEKIAQQRFPLTRTSSYQISLAMKRVNPEAPFVFPGMMLSKEVIAFADRIGAEISLDFEGIA